MNNLFIIFVLLNITNVILQTIKSICTINSSKTIAATINAIVFGFYTVILVYMSCDLSLLEKSLIVGLCNFIGVYVVKLIEEKTRKDKLWKVELTLNREKKNDFDYRLTALNIPHNYTNVQKWSIFNIYCKTQKQSAMVKELALEYNAKFFVSESKNL